MLSAALWARTLFCSGSLGSRIGWWSRGRLRWWRATRWWCLVVVASTIIAVTSGRHSSAVVSITAWRRLVVIASAVMAIAAWWCLIVFAAAIVAIASGRHPSAVITIATRWWLAVITTTVISVAAWRRRWHGIRIWHWRAFMGFTATRFGDGKCCWCLVANVAHFLGDSEALWNMARSWSPGWSIISAALSDGIGCGNCACRAERDVCGRVDSRIAWSLCCLHLAFRAVCHGGAFCDRDHRLHRHARAVVDRQRRVRY